MAERRPDFMIVGAMKCGTSTLHDQLALRSGLWMSTPKEPNFFSDDALMARGLDAYFELFAGARPEQLCGESSTHYTKLPTYPNTADNIARHVPNAKFVYVIRHPLERMASQFLHEWSLNQVRSSYDRAVRGLERYVAYSCYASQLQPFLDRFGADRVLLVLFERLVANPNAEFERVCKFIGDPSPEPMRWDESLGARNVSRERMRKSRLREAILGIPFVRWVKDRTPASLKEPLKDLWRRKERPVLSAATERWVVERIDEDLARLGGWLGSELSCASYRDVVRIATGDWGSAVGRES